MYHMWFIYLVMLCNDVSNNVANIVKNPNCFHSFHAKTGFLSNFNVI